MCFQAQKLPQSAVFGEHKLGRDLREVNDIYSLWPHCGKGDTWGRPESLPADRKVCSMCGFLEPIVAVESPFSAMTSKAIAPPVCDPDFFTRQEASGVCSGTRFARAPDRKARVQP